MDTQVERLQTQRLHAVSRLQALVAEAESRGMNPELRANIEQANSSYDYYSAQVNEMTTMRAKVNAADERRGGIASAISEQYNRSGRSGANPDPNAWFQRAIRGRIEGEYETQRTIDIGYDARALSVGSQGSGTTVPTTIADFVAVYERTLNPMMDVARVLGTKNGAPLVVPKVTADNTAGGSVTAEAAGITENDATFGRVLLGAFKVASTTLYSFELEQDADIAGLDDLLAGEIARPVSLGWGTYFTLGTGTTQPRGFLLDATNAGTALGTANGQATDKYWSATDLVNLFYALPAPYRLNGSWMTASVNKMRTFKDSTGQFIWAPGNIALGQPDTFLGRPVYENPAMAAAGSANTSIAFGDFSRYVVRDVQPVRLDISRDYKFNTDQLALRYITRRDGALTDNIAVQFLVSQAI